MLLTCSFGRCWEAEGLGNRSKRENSQKCLGEGAKGLLDPGSTKPLAPVQPHFAPVQKQFWVLGGAKDFSETFAPWLQKTFCTPKHFWEFSLFSQFPRPAASRKRAEYCFESTVSEERTH